MSYLSLMNHTAIQIFTTKTYHNYAYLLKHTRTLTNNKCLIARSQNTNSHTHPHYNHKNILQLHTHDQNKHSTPSTNIPTPYAPNTTNNTYNTHTQTKIKEIFTVPPTVLTLNHQKPNTRSTGDKHIILASFTYSSIHTSRKTYDMQTAKQLDGHI